jgi:hypothetical protein
MTDYIHLSATSPWGEPCAQLGTEDYQKDSRIEARTYIRQLQRVFGGNPDGTRFVLVKCPHDFGSYLDIKFFYDDEDQRHVLYMIDIETGCEKWDEESRKELDEHGYNVNETLNRKAL